MRIGNLYAWRFVVGVVGVMLLASALIAEDAVCTDGRVVAGRLSLDPAKRPVFTSKQGDVIPIHEIQFVRFTENQEAWSPWPKGARRLILRGGQTVSGRLHQVEANEVVFQPFWAEKPRKIERAWVEAVTHLPGWLTLVEDGFAEEERRWIQSGEAGERAGPGDRQILLLKKAKESLAWRLDEKSSHGRFTVAFRLPDAATTKTPARWLVEADFNQQKKILALAVAINQIGACAVTLAGAALVERKIDKPGEWTHLEIQFSPQAARVVLNGQPLWHNLENWPGGRLEEVRLLCREAGDEKPPSQNRLELSAFRLAAGCDEPRRPVGDLEQDEVCLAGGDQVFGQVGLAHAGEIEIAGPFGKKAVPWEKARGIWFRSTEPVPSRRGENRVRLTLDSGLGPFADELEGVLIGLNDKAVSLQHDALADVHLERSRLRRIHWLTPARAGR